MKRVKVCLFLLLLSAVVGVTSRPAGAAGSCVLPDGATQTPFFNSGITSPAICNELTLGTWIARNGTTPQVLAVVGCAVQVWNITGATPAEGPKFSGWYTAWGRNDEHNTHPLRHVAALDGFPYVLLSFTTEGWVLAKQRTDGDGLITGFDLVDHYKLPSSPSPEYALYAARMWRGNDGHVYVVARILDKATKEFKIFDLGTGAAAPALTAARSTLPTPSESSVFDVVKTAGQVYLLQWGKVGLHVFNVTDPGAPQLLTTRTESGLRHLTFQDFGPDYGYGPVVVNRGTESSPMWRAYVYRVGMSTLYIYDVTDPTSPVKLAELALGSTGGKIESIASDGKLLVAHRLRVGTGAATEPTPRAQYFSVVNDELDEIPSNVPWSHTAGDDIETSMGVSLARVAEKYKVLRMAYPRAYMDTVEVSCLNQTPTASLGVVRKAGMPGTPACTGDAQHAPVLGFPGDTFSLTNLSTQGVVLDKLEVSGPGQYYQDLTSTFLTGSADWASPNTEVAAGEYTFTLTAHDAGQNQLTDTVWVHLCNNPQARIAVTHVKTTSGGWQACTSCSWLQGYTLRFSALTSDGSPTGGWSTSNPTWDVVLCQPPAACQPAQSMPGTGAGTLELTLQDVGDYKVRASVAYPYAGTVQSNQIEAHSGAITAAFTAMQGTSTIAPNQSVLRGSPIQLTFTGVYAPPNTATCAWSILPAHWSGANGPCSTGAVIPANTLQANQSYTLSLTAVTSPAVDQAQASLAFTATDLTGDFTWNPASPQIGTVVTFSGSNLPGTVQKARWGFGEVGCDSAVHTSTKEVVCAISAECPVQFQFKSGGNKSVSLQISTDGTTFQQVATHVVNVASTGSCTTCTAPGTPSNTSPASGASVQAGSVTFTWSAAGGTPTPTYDVMLGSVNLCSGVSGTSCTKTLSTAGAYTWNVKAKNSCGETASQTTGFTVTAAPTGSFSWSPTTVQIGTEVTFTGTNLPAGVIMTRWLFGEVGCDSVAHPATMDVPCGFGACTSPKFKFKTGGSKNVSLQASTDGTNFQAVATRTVTVASTGACTTCVAPGSATTPTPVHQAVVPPGTVTLKWVAPATGTPTITYDVFLGTSKICADITATQCTTGNLQSGSFLWFVKAKNGCSSGGVQSATWTFSVCNASAVPVAGFTWSPSTPVTIGSVVQEQPYVGQTVTFDPSTSTNSPSAWDWTDFNTPVPWVHYTTRNPTHVWTTPGDKSVRLTATNCIGASTQVAKTVKIHADIRPVTASFAATVADQQNPQVVTFTAATGTEQGEPNHFTWDFGDGTTEAGADKNPVVHTFRCGSTYSVTLTAKRIKSGSTVASSPHSEEIQVGGEACSPKALLVMDVARNLPGKNGAVWNTDLTLFNSTEQNMTLIMAIKKNDGTPRDESARPFTMLPRETRDLSWVLTMVERDFTKASLWFYQASPSDRGGKPLPVISARTHTGEVEPYDDYGQFVMVYPVYQASDRKQTLYITGLMHNGSVAQAAGHGFRTNLTIVEPAGVGWSSGAIKLTLLKADDPTFKKERELWASDKYGYWQRSIETFFEGVEAEADLGRIIVMVEIDAGVAVALGTSLVNNSSNAPIYVPAQAAP